jgi:dTDP-4-amino-4,6-dideoxygalactose transaminase
MNNNKLLVTKPYLPPLTEFIPSLENIWNSRILTNNGPYHREFEKKLVDYLGVKNISLFNNGTTALYSCLKILDLKGEVITTPFSFVATSHALLLNDLDPVFVDINKNFNIDPKKIEAAITSRTSAILAVHCYGIPCDVDSIKEIADKYNLKVIYDAAHAFGVNCHCGSVLNHGDMSILSFHATKVFNTFEGGAIVSKDIDLKNKIDNFKNFGFKSEIDIQTIGINGKMSEFNAALGILQLKYIDNIILKRKILYEGYINSLIRVKGIHFLDLSNIKKFNYNYFPIVIAKEFKYTRDELYNYLISCDINCRRYFYPLISNFDLYKKNAKLKINDLKNSYHLSNNILCLPLFPDMDSNDVSFIVEKIVNINR